jgi:hypothetical protein
MKNDPYLALSDILAERSRQDTKWGGPDHDDTHPPFEWVEIVAHQVERTIDEGTERPGADAAVVRARLVKIAAVALAGIQSIDRIAKREAGNGS